ncbi:MAG TPA: SRPBCC family protein [Candidatus Limnocylindrales bacterium]|nr:SRPBCC family protein [Candidatus Limnocylindrales bacterium]
MKSRFVAERRMAVPAQVAYHCLADYREHHRPDGFLPPAFSDLEIRHGGVGAGTEASWTVALGGRNRRMSATISEPEPGRRLVETGDGVVTTFTVAPSGSGCVVRFDSVFDEPGLGGVLLRLFIGRIVGPLYADELARLEAYAGAHGPVAVAA